MLSHEIDQQPTQEPSTPTDDAGQGVTFVTVAPEGQVPVDTLLGQQARRPSKWRTLLAWQDWRLSAKLAAITVVPLLVAVVLGTIAIVGQAQQAGRTDRSQQLVALSTHLHTLVSYIQHERAVTVELLSPGVPADKAELRAARGTLSSSAAAFTNRLREFGFEQHPRLAERAEQARTALDKLPGIRDAVSGGGLDAATAVGKYAQVADALLDLDTALVGALRSSELDTTPSVSHQLAVATEMFAIERALVGYGVQRSALPPSTQHQLRAAETRFRASLADARLLATPERLAAINSAVPADTLRTRKQLVSTALNGTPAEPGGAVGSISAQRWNATAETIASALAGVSGTVDKALTERAEELAGGATAGLVVLIVVLVLAFALALLVGVVIARQVLRQLRQLRDSVGEVAQYRLPAVVHSVQHGDTNNTAVAPIPVRGSDELGQLARTFDEVHGQAVRIAADQAAMRTAYGNVFVNLSRRSQSLVQRQLHLIERLERDEEDADQLATLFQLDHLATRMRRNNENLLVLSGGESGRRSSQPVTVTDVLRAAVSEIEQYQRVAVRAAPDARVVGHVASDLMRLLAELLDNATAFSAPETHVTLATRMTEERALSIDVLDKGIGMSAAEVDEANSRMAEAASVDLTTSRRMGLFVVGRLASKHGFRVTLYGGRDITGVRANVVIPGSLLAGAPAGPAAAGAPAEEPAPSPAPGALPRRNRNGNGSSAAIAQSLPGSQARPATSGESTSDGGNEPPPAETEVSGTALFTPIGPEQTSSPAPEPAQPPQQPAQLAEADQVDDVPQEEDGAEDTEPAAVPESGTVEQTAASAQSVAGAPSKPVGPSGRKDDLPAGQELFVANANPLTQWWGAATKAHDEAARASRQTPKSPDETTPIFNEMLSAWFRETEPDPGSRSQASETEQATQSGREWDFAADENWRTVESISRTAPESYTPSGLPRRRRGEHLLPGSAGRDDTSGTDEPAATTDGTGTSRRLPTRDPADVRGRLSSFQRGVSRGKQQREDGQDGQDSQQEFAWPTQEPPAARTSPEASQPTESDDASAGASGSWIFASDERLREVRSVSGSGPSGYTQAGLPRRRRGEKLLPGSASKPEAVPGPRAERDPDNVRGRLSSFQQGIRRGRHQTTQPTDGNHDQMEGE